MLYVACCLLPLASCLKPWFKQYAKGKIACFLLPLASCLLLEAFVCFPGIPHFWCAHSFRCGFFRNIYVVVFPILCKWLRPLHTLLQLQACNSYLWKLLLTCKWWSDVVAGLSPHHCRIVVVWCPHHCRIVVVWCHYVCKLHWSQQATINNAITTPVQAVKALPFL